MLVLHAHWQPPHTSSDTGGVLFWAETSEVEAPAWMRGRQPNKPRPKDHPFCASLQKLGFLLGNKGRGKIIPLLLPTRRSGPQPSPELVHGWELDQGTRPF